ncbi:tetratricopeptide repeat protein, partial [Enterococcus faecium]|uniref:tetratricopeptide repeat protein n=1 Tax=Enterococcus faecium TaxID=1352 RepID=UPI003AABDDAA
MENRIAFIVLCICFAFTTNAQWYDSDKVKEKSAKLYAKAIEFLRNDEFKEAMPYLLSAIEADTNHLDAYLSAAGVFGQLKQYKRSIHFYEKARSKDSVYFNIYNLPYSINLA